MGIARIRPMKVERPGEGGITDDTAGGFCEVDIGVDYVDCAGITVQKPGSNTTSSDTLARVERTAAGALHFVDPIANGQAGLDLSQIVNALSGTPGSHNALGDIIHWLGGGGPGDGYASGAYLTVTTTGIYPSAYTWYASNAQGANKLFQVSIAYTGVVPASITYVLYNAAGSAIRTVVDTLSYTSPFYGNATRTWS